MAVCDIAKEMGVTLTDTSFKIRKFCKENKQVEVKFADRKLQFEIFKNSSKLRGSKTFSKNFLNPDYTQAEKLEQFELQQVLQKRKSDGQPKKTWVLSSFVESKMGQRNSI